jgi:hypothetical protein
MKHISEDKKKAFIKAKLDFNRTYAVAPPANE